ncbi:MAG: hypothetical protein KDD84_03315 [Caldilineaceae bacterium]|nr:hypothetical protein [Caldilineaceae bacterium]
MQTHAVTAVNQTAALRKRIFFVVAAIVFWLCYLTAVTPVHADIDESVMPQAPVAGMATWHG